MSRVSRLVNSARRQFLRRSESEGPRTLSPHGSPLLYNPVAMVRPSSPTTASKMFSTVSAPSTPLRAARAFPQVSSLLEGFDPVQVSLLDEQCILVDENDKVVGTGSKKDCHLMVNINQGLLHRAFSVFLFNSNGELLLQQRSDAKITFPGAYTNSCCSHPLATPSELTENPIEGVKRAAQRRMYIELGIPPEELPLSCFHYLTRIKYKAPSDGMWGEHEVDYILFVQKDIKTIRPNPNEIKSIRYLAQHQILDFIEEIRERDEPLTPWFELILNSFLEKWWSNLPQLNALQDHEVIHKLN